MENNRKKGNGGTNNIKIMVPVKYLEISLTLEMSLINCKFNLQLKWSEKSFIKLCNVL